MAAPPGVCIGLASGPAATEYAGFFEEVWLTFSRAEVLSELEEVLRLQGSSFQAGGPWVLGSWDYVQFFQNPKREGP